MSTNTKPACDSCTRNPAVARVYVQGRAFEVCEGCKPMAEESDHLIETMTEAKAVLDAQRIALASMAREAAEVYQAAAVMLAVVVTDPVVCQLLQHEARVLTETLDRLGHLDGRLAR